MFIDWSKQRLLVISPHADDETMMAGGLMQLVETAYVVLGAVADTGSGAKAKHQQWMEALTLLGACAVDVTNCPDVYPGVFSLSNGCLYDEVGLRKAIRWLDAVLAATQPDIVVMPMNSHHQDHRFIRDATLAALRPRIVGPQMVLEGEYPHTCINPYNVETRSHLYVSITPEQLSRKIQALRTQRIQIGSNPVIADMENIRTMAKMRGLECCSPTGLAERFVTHRFWC